MCVEACAVLQEDEEHTQNTASAAPQRRTIVAALPTSGVTGRPRVYAGDASGESGVPSGGTSWCRPWKCPHRASGRFFSSTLGTPDCAHACLQIVNKFFFGGGEADSARWGAATALQTGRLPKACAHRHKSAYTSQPCGLELLLLKPWLAAAPMAHTQQQLTILKRAAESWVGHAWRTASAQQACRERTASSKPAWQASPASSERTQRARTEPHSKPWAHDRGGVQLCATAPDKSSSSPPQLPALLCPCSTRNPANLTSPPPLPSLPPLAFLDAHRDVARGAASRAARPRPLRLGVPEQRLGHCLARWHVRTHVVQHHLFERRLTDSPSVLLPARPAACGWQGVLSAAGPTFDAQQAATYAAGQRSRGAHLHDSTTAWRRS
eukprot:363643-Chlamydomonas_euryale.AAC.14